MHYRLFISCSLFLVLSVSAIPSHAVPITIDSAVRSVAASLDFSPGTQRQSSSLGLFSETVNVGFVSPVVELSSQGSQISNISLSGNTLALNVAASAITNIAPTDTSGGGSSFASSGASFLVQFTLDNWAAYDAHSFVSPVDSHISFAFYSLSEAASPVLEPILGFVPFSVSGTIPYVENRSGLLAPGTYRYRLDTSVNVHPPHYGIISSSAFSSLTVSIVPEPSSVLLILFGLGCLVLTKWNEKRTRQLLATVLVMLSQAVPLLAEASPITPNPNPVGSTINIVDDLTASTGAGPFFLNAGTINTDSSSKLTITAPLANAGALNNYGGVAELNITNTGTINNFGGFTDLVRGAR